MINFRGYSLTRNNRMINVKPMCLIYSHEVISFQ